MTDSPTPGRHRSKPSGRRGLIGPVVSALSVLLATGPVVWVMASRDGSTVADDPTKVLNISEDNSGPAAVDSSRTVDGQSTGKPQATVTKTLPNGVTTTITPTGVPVVGPADSTLSNSTGTPKTTGGPATTAPTNGGTKTVTVTPKRPRTVTSRTTSPRPKPSKPNRPTGPSTPTSTRTTTVTTKPTPSDPPPGGGGTNAQEREVLELTNAARRERGCGPVALDDSLVEAAGSHAADMVRRQYLSHNTPEGKDPGDRMRAAGFNGSGWGENIAAGYESAQRVFAVWMNSEGHRNNILNCKFDKIGIGYDPGRVKPDWSNGSWVQDFGRG